MPQAADLKSQLRRAIGGQLKDFMNKHPEAVVPSWKREIDGVSKFVASAEKRILGEVLAVLDRQPKP